MCGDLEMADGRLTTPVTLIGTQPLVAGALSVVGDLGGDGVFYGPPLAQAGQASRGPELGWSWAGLLPQDVSRQAQRLCHEAHGLP